MVHRQIYDHLDSSFMTLRNQAFKIIQCSIFRINVHIIHYIIFMIGSGRHHRHKPDHITAQILLCTFVSIVYIVQFMGHTIQITDTIPIAVIEAIHKNLIAGIACPFCCLHRISHKHGLHAKYCHQSLDPFLFHSLSPSSCILRVLSPSSHGNF